MLSRFSHQTTCTEVRLEGERRAELSQAQPEGVQGTCGTHRVAKQVHSEVRVIDPREAQALRSREHIADLGPGSSLLHRFRDEGTGHLSQTQSLGGRLRM